MSFSSVRAASALLSLSVAAVSVGAVAPPATTSTLPTGFKVRTVEFSGPNISRMEEHPINRDIYVIGMFSPLFRVDVHNASMTAEPVANVRALGLPFGAYASGIDFDSAGNAYVCSHNGQILKGIYDSAADGFSTWTLFANLEDEVGIIGEHGFGGLAIDRKAGALYINSGSITAGNDETGPEPDHGINASILRLNLDSGALSVYAKGIRNHFGLTVRSDGRVFGLENASDCDYAEEFNMITEGNHYGFPFRSASDRSGSDAGLFPSCDQDDPSTTSYTGAWGNLGPDAVPSPGEPGYVDGGIYYGFTPHTTPTGIDFYEPSEMDPTAILFPADYHGRAFMTRFGSEGPGGAAGSDLLTLGLQEQDRQFFTNAFLTQLSQPLDVVCASNGKVYVLEFQQLAPDAPPGPGRLIEVAYTNTTPPVSFVSARQKLHVSTEGTGYQVLQYRYSTGTTWVSPYMATSGSVPFFPVQNEFIGLFHYDYATARFNQAAYHMLDALP